MINSDYLQRFLFENIAVRGELVHLHQSFSTIMDQHDYPPLIKKLLGESLVVVTLLSAIIKFKGRLTLQFQSANNLKLILVQATEEFHIRGLAQWEGELDEEAVLASLQKGVLVITVDPDSSVNKYQGIVSWQGQTVAESIEGYFRDSEQLLTRIWTAVSDTKAVGLLLQALPKGNEHTERLTSETDWEHLTILTDTVKPEELLSLDTETLLSRLYVEDDVRVFEATPVIFRCTCNPKRGENAILLLGREEAEDELRLKQAIVVKCDFCNKEYVFDRVDVENIFRKGNSPPASMQIH